MRAHHCLFPPLLVLLHGCQAAAEPPPKTAGPSVAVTAPAACQKPGLPQVNLTPGEVEIETKPKPTRLKVELCLSDQERMIGMMCRTRIDPREGMLFVFPRSKPRSFWMKNTLLPLDMIFFDEEGRIVALIEKAAPLTLTARRARMPAKFVLEIGGGRAKALGIEVGQYARFGGLPEGSVLKSVRLGVLGK